MKLGHRYHYLKPIPAVPTPLCSRSPAKGRSEALYRTNVVRQPGSRSPPSSCSCHGAQSCFSVIKRAQTPGSVQPFKLCHIKVAVTEGVGRARVLAVEQDSVQQGCCVQVEWGNHRNHGS